MSSDVGALVIRVRVAQGNEPSLPVKVVTGGPSDPILVVARTDNGPSIPVRSDDTLTVGQTYRVRFAYTATGNAGGGDEGGGGEEAGAWTVGTSTVGGLDTIS